jgi:pimeloyl-ACP methyl ester carboxylesterase
MKSPDVIILHGWNLSGQRFEPLKKILKTHGFTVLNPDLPGFGQEQPPPAPWHVSDYAKFVHDFIVKNKLKKPILIGHSFGGRVGLKLTQMYPDDLHSIILTGVPGFSPVASRKRLLFLLLAKVGGMIFRIPPFSLFAYLARKLLYRFAGAHEFNRAKGSMQQTFKFTVSDDLTEAMKLVKIPCLLVWGKLDSMVPLSVANRMLTLIPDSKLVVIKEGDHGVPYKDAPQFYSFIKEYLQN